MGMGHKRGQEKRRREGGYPKRRRRKRGLVARRWLVRVWSCDLKSRRPVRGIDRDCWWLAAPVLVAGGTLHQK
jgi:hypothetical protein